MNKLKIPIYRGNVEVFFTSLFLVHYSLFDIQKALVGLRRSFAILLQKYNPFTTVPVRKVAISVIPIPKLRGKRSRGICISQ